MDILILTFIPNLKEKRSSSSSTTSTKSSKSRAILQCSQRSQCPRILRGGRFALVHRTAAVDGHGHGNGNGIVDRLGSRGGVSSFRVIDSSSLGPRGTS